MVQWLFVILVYDFAILKLSFSEVTLSLRLLHYKNRNGLTYGNRPCDTRIEHDINRDGRCDTGFLFCLVRLPFQNPHNCTLGDHFTGFVGADDIHFINIDKGLQRSATSKLVNRTRQRSSLISLWFQPTIHFRFKYPKDGIGIVVEVFDIDDPINQTIHDSIDFYGRTLLDLKLSPSLDAAQSQRILLRSLFGSYTNLTADFSLYCSPDYYGDDCETYCSPNQHRYECDPKTGQKICKHGYLGQDCLSDVRACEDQPCLNNGTCVVYLRSYLCQCPIGYTGRSCEIGPILKTSNDLCNRTACVHGHCSKSGKCICHDSWTAENCNESLIRKPNNCASLPCLHNSTCENFVSNDSSFGYRCHCQKGYTGRHCEVAIVTSCERTPCLHGQCLKIDLYTEVCICEQYWTGVDCSQPSTTSTTTTTTTTTMTTTTHLSISTRNLTNLPFTTDLSEYFNRFNIQSEAASSTNTYQTSTPYKNNHSPCLSTPCLHNSTCIIRSDTDFQCLCSTSFIGIYCEIETNPCENSPCQHGSICVTKSNHEIQCICSVNYTGNYCENAASNQPSRANPKCTRTCHNGGHCSINESNQEQCICMPSHTGFFCELAKNNCTDSSCSIDPCFSNPCLFNGTCHTLSNSTNFTCSCLEDYTGEQCEYMMGIDPLYALPGDRRLSDDDVLSKTSPDLWPLAIVFGYVFSLMLVFIIIWFLWYGLTNRPQSNFRSELPHHERSTDRYEPYRLGVSNPLFFLNQDYNPNQILKTY